MANMKYTVKATASTIITDETDISYLTGGLNIINSSKNQIYYTGQSNPYSPDWERYNLVIRPYLRATNIHKSDNSGTKYNPDLFSPEEYRTFDDCGYEQPIITDIHWYIQDNSGSRTEITRNSDGYSFSWKYQSNDYQSVTCSDARQLVINKNILQANTSREIIIVFSYHDPYANVNISQEYSISITNLATGQTTNKAVIEAINGNSIHNGIPNYIDLEAHYYRDGIEIDLQEELEDAISNTNIKWYIRDILNGGWKLLDSITQNSTGVTLYNICKKNYTNKDNNEYTTEIEENIKGGVILRIYPDLINGSDSIKLVISDSMQNGKMHNDLIVVYDETDETKAYIHLNNGNKLKRSDLNAGTTAKVVITYKGVLLEDTSELYNNEFIYYWYKYNFDTQQYSNIWTGSDGRLLSKTISSLEDTENVVPSARSIYITPNDIDKQEEIIVHIVERSQQISEENRTMLFTNMLVSEFEVQQAALINNELGIEDDSVAQLFTAHELRQIRLNEED